MIGPTGAVRVLVATRPVDFRKGAEGLAALVREQMQADPFSGAIYVFRAKRADRVKLIYLGWHWRMSVRQAAGGWQVPLAERAGWRHAAVGCGAVGAFGRTGLEARSRSTGDTGADAAGMTAAR